MPSQKLIESFYKYLTSTSTAEALKKTAEDENLSDMLHKVVTCTTDYDATIVEILQQAQEGNHYDVLLTGSAGSGKTHLMQVLAKNDAFDLQPHSHPQSYSFAEGKIPVVTITDATSDLPIITENTDSSSTMGFFKTLFNIEDDSRQYSIIIAMNEGPLRQHRDSFRSAANRETNQEEKKLLQDIAGRLERTLEYLRDAQYGYDTEYSEELPVVIDLASKSPVLFKHEYLAQLFTGDVDGADFRKEDLWEAVIRHHFATIGSSSEEAEQFVQAFAMFCTREERDEKLVFPVVSAVFKLLAMVVHSGEQITWRHLMNWMQELFLPKQAHHTSFWFYRLFYGTNRLSTTLRKIITPAQFLVLPKVEHLLYDKTDPSTDTAWTGLLKANANAPSETTVSLGLFRARQLHYFFSSNEALTETAFQLPFLQKKPREFLQQINKFMSYNHDENDQSDTNTFTNFYIWWHCNVEGRRTNGQMIGILDSVDFEHFKKQSGHWICNTPEEVRIDKPDNGTWYLTLKERHLKENSKFHPLKLTLKLWEQMHEPRNASVVDRTNQEFTVTLEKFGLEILTCHKDLQRDSVALLNRHNQKDSVLFYTFKKNDDSTYYISKK